MTDIAPLSSLPMPLVAAVEMGYGHVRAALPLAQALGSPLRCVDRAPLCAPKEERLWLRVRSQYESLTRLSRAPGLGLPLQWLLDLITRIPPLHPSRDLSAPTQGVRTLERLVRHGLGAKLVEELARTGAPLLTTYFTPAIVADRAGIERVTCVVTDTDVNRVWAPLEPHRTRIRYLVPTRRAGRRLQAYGVPEDRITFTGFPLPPALLGGPDLPVLRRNLADRLARLDPEGNFREQTRALEPILGMSADPARAGPPLLTFAVGGAGAQADLPATFLPSLRPLIVSGRLRLALVAGVRADVSRAFRRALRASRLEGATADQVELLEAGDLETYFERFNALLARTDLLWTKPSELCFYAALGLPIVCAPPVGFHEGYNQRWLRENGAGLDQRDPRCAGDWLLETLSDGTLAAAAWSGFLRLPKHGLYRILREVGAPAQGGLEVAAAMVPNPACPRGAGR